MNFNNWISSRFKKILSRVRPIEVKDYSDEVEFGLKPIEIGTQKTYYKNIKTARCPFDYVMYQMIIFELQPDLIIEIGTSEGGSCIYYADLLDIIGKGKIHTIDITDNRVNPQDENANHVRVQFFTDGYENYDLKNAEGYETILIIDDGSHTYEDVLASLKKFNSLVSVGSYFIVEDGIIDHLGVEVSKWFNGGPNRAIKEFLINNDSFIIDRKWCDFFGKNATFNTNGYLKKIKNSNSSH